MTIKVQEQPGWTGEAKADGSREYTRTFLIIIPHADLPQTEATLSLLPGIPRRYDLVGPQDMGALCVDLSLREHSDSVNLWTATAKYSTQHGDPEQHNEPNPLLRGAIWRYSSSRGTRTEPVDRQDNAYETAAGEPLLSPPENVHSTARYTITRNEAIFSGDNADNFANTVNEASWYGKPKWSVLCEGISADPKFENDVAFWVVRYVLHVDRNGWMPKKIANKGYVYLDNAGVRQQSDVLRWLNHNGEIWINADPDDQKYLGRYPFDEADFDAFNL